MVAVERKEGKAKAGSKMPFAQLAELARGIIDPSYISDVRDDAWGDETMGCYCGP